MDIDIENHLKKVLSYGAGEILLQSIDQDGTEMGLDTKILKYFKNIEVPIILMGGVGNYQHIAKGIKLKNCDAISTANLFNFVANEFEMVRKNL